MRVHRHFGFILLTNLEYLVNVLREVFHRNGAVLNETQRFFFTANPHHEPKTLLSQHPYIVRFLPGEKRVCVSEIALLEFFYHGPRALHHILWSVSVELDNKNSGGISLYEVRMLAGCEIFSRKMQYGAIEDLYC